MDNGHLIARRDIGRQPFHQFVHRAITPSVDVFQILLGPSPDLPGKIIARLAEIAQPGGDRINHVQIGHRLVHGVEIGAAFGLGHAREGRIPDHPAVHTVHDVEPGADHVIVLAQAKGAGDGEALRKQRGDHLVFAVHRVSRGQQLARRLAAQHIILARRDELVGRIGLPTLELLDAQRAGIAFNVGLHPLREPAGIDLLAWTHRAGA